MFSRRHKMRVSPLFILIQIARLNNSSVGGGGRGGGFAPPPVPNTQLSGRGMGEIESFPPPPLLPPLGYQGQQKIPKTRTSHNGCTATRTLHPPWEGQQMFTSACVVGWLPEFSEQFSIVDFPGEFRSVLVQVNSFNPFIMI